MERAPERAHQLSIATARCDSDKVWAVAPGSPCGHDDTRIAHESNQVGIRSKANTVRLLAVPLANASCPVPPIATPAACARFMVDSSRSSYTMRRIRTCWQHLRRSACRDTQACLSPPSSMARRGKGSAHRSCSSSLRHPAPRPSWPAPPAPPSPWSSAHDGAGRESEAR